MVTLYLRQSTKHSVSVVKDRHSEVHIYINEKFQEKAKADQESRKEILKKKNKVNKKKFREK